MQKSAKDNILQNLPKDPEGIRPFIGIALLLISGLAFAASMLIASTALKSGIGLMMSNALSYSVAAVMLFIYQKITKRPLIIPPQERNTALALGIPVFMMGIVRPRYICAFGRWLHSTLLTFFSSTLLAAAKIIPPPAAMKAKV